jgi:hypothetical protein
VPFLASAAGSLAESEPAGSRPAVAVLVADPVEAALIGSAGTLVGDPVGGLEVGLWVGAALEYGDMVLGVGRGQKSPYSCHSVGEGPAVGL